MAARRAVALISSLFARALGTSHVHMSATWDRVVMDRVAQRITINHDPASGANPEATVIVLHGLGDTAQGWADVATMWAGQMPSVRFVLPTAPVRPVTLNGGMRMTAWYDIVNFDADQADQDLQGIRESRRVVDTIVREEAAAVGGAGRVLLAGFSQGGALALFAGLQRAEEPVSGVLCMSGYLPIAAEWQVAQPSLSVPVLLCHGDADPIVLPEWADNSARALRAQGVTSVNLIKYPSMPHSVCEQEIQDASQFIAKSLALHTG